MLKRLRASIREGFARAFPMVDPFMMVGPDPGQCAVSVKVDSNAGIREGLADALAFAEGNKSRAEMFEVVPDFASTVAAAVMGLKWAGSGCDGDDFALVDAMDSRYAEVQGVVAKALADFNKAPADDFFDEARRIADQCLRRSKIDGEISPFTLEIAADVILKLVSRQGTPTSPPPAEDLAGQGEPVAWALKLADAFERSGKTLYFPEQFPVGYPAGWDAAHHECAKDLRHAAKYSPTAAPAPSRPADRKSDHV